MKSTQKLPSSREERRVRPRMKAAAAAMPDRGRDEVLARERQHLREVAHRRLRHVDLPVGVGGEARGGVEGVPGVHARDVRGVQGQVALQAQDRVDEEEDDEVEDDQGEDVADHAHLALLVDPAEAVDQALDRPQDRVEERALALVDVRHVRAQRLREQREQHEEDDDLKDAECHGFRTSPAGAGRTGGSPSGPPRRPGG